MKTGTTTHYALCRFKNRPDATCRKLARCRVCGRVLFFSFADRLCSGCAESATRRSGPPSTDTGKAVKS